MIRQVVIDKVSKQVKRHGFCNFENDGSFNSETEEIIEKDFIFNPDIDEQDWYWNEGIYEFQQTAP